VTLCSGPLVELTPNEMKSILFPYCRKMKVSMCLEASDSCKTASNAMGGRTAKTWLSEVEATGLLYII
jgi:hypothetical protein